MSEVILSECGIGATHWGNHSTGELVISWLGQAGFLFKTQEGTMLCIDPYLSNSVEKSEGPEARRMWFPTFSMENFAPHAVICTHDHLDHTDPETLPLIAAYSTAVFYGPEESCNHMLKMSIGPERIVLVHIGKEYLIRDITILSVYAKHTSGSIGIILKAGGFTIYITGDTEYCDELLVAGAYKPDLLIACINGKYGNLNMDEALTLAKRLRVSAVIPMHYGLIPTNTVNPDEFIQKCSEAGMQCFVLEEEKEFVLHQRLS